jgi:uncharacterized protein (TIGR00730 family)
VAQGLAGDNTSTRSMPHFSPHFGQQAIPATPVVTTQVNDQPLAGRRYAVPNTPLWVDKGLQAAKWLDMQAVPRALYALTRLTHPHMTLDDWVYKLRSRPYALSNIFYRLKYPRLYGVHVYGSARPSPTNDLKDYYEMGQQVGKSLAKAGLFSVTGGGPGVMAAVALGAKAGGGHTVGVAVPQLDEQDSKSSGSAIDNRKLYDECISAPSFTHRLKGPGGFFHRAGRVLILPGGTGTLREMLEAYEEVGYVDSISHFPQQRQIVVLDYNRFFSTSVKPMLDKLIAEGMASPSIYDIIKVVPTIDDALKALKDPTVRWTNGLSRHRERNLKYHTYSPIQTLERMLHKLHWTQFQSKTVQDK